MILMIIREEETSLENMKQQLEGYLVLKDKLILLIFMLRRKQSQEANLLLDLITSIQTMMKQALD